MTKEVTWEIPDDYEHFLRQSAIDSNRKNAKNTWILCQGDDQTEYYFNEYTRSISWDRPVDYVEPVEYIQANIDENSSVQQVRGQEFAVRQSKTERKSKESTGKTQSTNNNSDSSM